jgi:hypothetical protein
LARTLALTAPAWAVVRTIVPTARAAINPPRDRPLVNVAIMVFIPFQVCQLLCDHRLTEGTQTPPFREDRGDTGANGTGRKTPNYRDPWHFLTKRIALLR